jgi:excisionase family DNA binding protein
LDGTLADRIADSRKALTAYQLAELLSVSAISIFRLAKRDVIPAFRVGTSVRFCPAAIARWLRERGG